MALWLWQSIISLAQVGEGGGLSWFQYRPFIRASPFRLVVSPSSLLFLLSSSTPSGGFPLLKCEWVFVSLLLLCMSWILLVWLLLCLGRFLHLLHMQHGLAVRVKFLACEFHLELEIFLASRVIFGYNLAFSPALSCFFGPYFTIPILNNLIFYGFLMHIFVWPAIFWFSSWTMFCLFSSWFASFLLSFFIPFCSFFFCHLYICRWRLFSLL